MGVDGLYPRNFPTTRGSPCRQSKTSIFYTSRSTYLSSFTTPSLCYPALSGYAQKRGRAIFVHASDVTINLERSIGQE